MRLFRLLPACLGLAAVLSSGFANDARALTLTPYAVGRGFSHTTFASGFPPSGSGAGPIGVAFRTDGSVLVSHVNGNLYTFPTHADGQTAGPILPTSYGSSVAIRALAQIYSGGVTHYYLGLQLAGEVREINPVTGASLATITSLPNSLGLAPFPSGITSPRSNHLFLASGAGSGTIVDIDPFVPPPGNSTTFASIGTNGDGICFSPDGSMLYAVKLFGAGIVGFSVPPTGPGTLVYTSPTIPASGPDGIAIGLGSLTGYLYTNANDGTIWEIGLPGGPTPGSMNQIASGGTRGDFIATDSDVSCSAGFPSLLVTQGTSIERLCSPPGGGFFGPPTSSTDPVTCTALWSDTEFNPGDWETVTITTGGGGSVTTNQVLTGGNPDAYRSVQTVVNTGPASVYAIQLRSGAIYDPVASGGIAGISYSEDAKLLAGLPTGQATGPALRQNGITYVANLLATPEAAWTRKQVLDLTATSFSNVNVPTAHPDFSETGAPIQLGFFRANSAAGGGYTRTVGIDNWAIRVCTICTDTRPPAAAALSALCDAEEGVGLCATLSWTAPQDPVRNRDSFGNCLSSNVAASAYDIRWSIAPIVSEADFTAANQAVGEPVPSAPGSAESFEICELPSGTVYFALRSIDAGQNVSAITTDQSICLCYHDFQTRKVYPTGITPTSVAIADLNGDGARDLAVADRYAAAVSILINDGTGSFNPKVDYPTGAGVTWVAIADLNGNGRPDLVTADQDANTMSVLLDNGSGGFGAPVPYPTGSGPTSLVLDDFNNDGRPDVAVANLLSSSVSVRLGSSDGTFGTRTDYPTAAGAFGIASHRMNGDGTVDLAVACVNADKVSVLLGNGNGTFKPKTDYTTGSWPFSVAMADMTGDGKPDLIVSNVNSATVSIFPGDAVGGFLPPTDYTTGHGPTRVVLGDVVGSHLDLVTSNYDDNTVSILAGNGAGVFAPKVDLLVGSSPQSVAVGDLNQDGNPDIAAVNYEAGTVSVLLNCTAILSAPPLSAPTEISLGLATQNPVTGPLRVTFALPKAARVQVQVLDVLGRSIAKLADGSYPPGRHSAVWDGADDGVSAPAGIYFVRLQAEGKAYTRQFVRLK